MSVKTLSPKATSVAPYKKLLIKAERLRGKGGEAAYERAKILVAVFNDTDFRLDNGNIDDFKAAEALDDYVQDLCLSFRQLQDLLTYYPEKAQWSEGKLRSMHDEILSQRSTPEKAVKPRRSASLAQVQSLEKENEQLAYQLKKAQKRIKQLEDENAHLKSRLRLAA